MDKRLEAAAKAWAETVHPQVDWYLLDEITKDAARSKAQYILCAADGTVNVL